MAHTGYSLKEIGNRFREGIYSKSEVDSLNQAQEDASAGSNRLNSNVLSSINLQNGIEFKGAGSITHDAPSTSTGINRYGELETVAVDESFHNEKGMRFDAESTNLYTQSEDLLNAAWNTVPTKVTGGFPSPDGGTSAVEFASTDTAASGFNQPVVLTGPVVTWSIKVKAGTSSTFTIRPLNFTNNPRTLVDLETRTSTLDAATFKDLADGWVEVSVSWDAGADLDGIVYLYMATDGSNYAAIAGETMYACMPQIEEQPVVTSYIPTTTTAVTRLQSVTSLPTRNNMPDISKGAGLFIEFTPEHTFSNNDLLTIYVDSSNYFICRIDGDSNRIRIYSNKDSALMFSGYSEVITSLLNSTIKLGVSFRSDGFDIYVNNVLSSTVSVTITTNAALANLTTRVGSLTNTLNPFTGYIKSIKWVDYTPTETEMKLS